LETQFFRRSWRCSALGLCTSHFLMDYRSRSHKSSVAFLFAMDNRILQDAVRVYGPKAYAVAAFQESKRWTLESLRPGPHHSISVENIRGLLYDALCNLKSNKDATGSYHDGPSLGSSKPNASKYSRDAHDVPGFSKECLTSGPGSAGTTKRACEESDDTKRSKPRLILIQSKPKSSL
jgi:hypothetical protein